MSQISILNFFTQYFAKLKIGIWQFFFEETTKLEKKSEGKPPLCTLNFLVVFPNIPTIPLMFSRISVKVTSKACLGFHFLCWILGVVPFNMWLISSRKENNCCYKLSNWQNDNFKHFEWNKCHFGHLLSL